MDIHKVAHLKKCITFLERKISIEKARIYAQQDRIKFNPVLDNIDNREFLKLLSVRRINDEETKRQFLSKEAIVREEMDDVLVPFCPNIVGDADFNNRRNIIERAENALQKLRMILDEASDKLNHAIEESKKYNKFSNMGLECSKQEEVTSMSKISKENESLSDSAGRQNWLSFCH